MASVIVRIMRGNIIIFVIAALKHCKGRLINQNQPTRFSFMDNWPITRIQMEITVNLIEIISDIHYYTSSPVIFRLFDPNQRWKREL